MSRVIASCIVQHVLENSDKSNPHDENTDWTPDVDNPDAPADLGAHTNKVLSADWRWLAWHELTIAKDSEAEMPDIDSELPDDVDEFEIELNGHTYHVLRSEDVGEQKAKDQIREQLQNEPENFDQDWLEYHINTDKLTELLWADQENMLREQHDSDEEWRDFLIDDDRLERSDFYTEEDDEELPISRDLSALIEEARDAWIEAQKASFDGMEWLRDIYSADEVSAKAIEIAGLSIEAATNDAVASDGWAHFISTYDSNYYALPSGAVYYRD